MDRAHVGRLFDEYADDVYSFLVYYTGTRDVDDMVQETFIKALQAIDRFEGRSNPKTWLLRIARNVSIDQYRRNKRSQNWVSDDLLHAVESEERSPEELVEMRDTNNLLLQLLDQLKPVYREVILYRAVLDMSVEETAQALNWPSSRVRVTFHRAIKAVRGLSNGVL